MIVNHSEPYRHDPQREIRIGPSSWDSNVLSVKVAYQNAKGHVARGCEVPADAVPQMLDMLIRKGLKDLG
jgi:hypothetical protein